MPRGDKSSYTDKQKRQAGHIEKGYEERCIGKKEAESRAWATVNKENGGGISKPKAQVVPSQAQPSSQPASTGKSARKVCPTVFPSVGAPSK